MFTNTLDTILRQCSILPNPILTVEGEGFQGEERGFKVRERGFNMRERDFKVIGGVSR